MSGRYRIQELIASGGMGRVYRATQEPLGRSVALKVVRHEDEADDEETMLSQRRLELEATLLGQLQHPNIVTLYDFGEIEGAFKGRSFLAMELLQGRTLQAWLDVDRRLSPARVVAMAEQMVRGLGFAHQRGIVHRDLKPSNVILLRGEDGGETVKLVDFGIGQMLNQDGATHGLTRTGAIIGTVGYIAPEQLHSRATPASDLFALGVVLFEALAGRPPFERTTPGTEGVAAPAPRLRDVAPDLELPEGLEALVASLLALDPDERPSASEVLRQLAGCHGSVGPTAPVDVASRVVPPVSAAPATRSDLLVRICLLAIVAYAVVLIAMFSHGGPPRRAPEGSRESQAAPVAPPLPEVHPSNVVVEPPRASGPSVRALPRRLAAPAPAPAPAPASASPPAPASAPASPSAPASAPTGFSTFSTEK